MQLGQPKCRDSRVKHEVVVVNPIPNPDSWMDAITILLATLIVAVPSWFSVRNHKAIQKMDKSISNGHTYPLREDVDMIRDTLTHISNDLHGVKSELGDLRHELREERRDRIELDDRFEKYRRMS